MKTIHKFIAAIILFVILAICYGFDASMTEAVSQNLVTFFSVVFGFYITAIAILYNSSFTKMLYEQIDDKGQQRGIHILKAYFLTSGYWAIGSIVAITVYMMFGTLHGDEIIWPIQAFTIPILNFVVWPSLLVTSSIYGISAVNVFFMLLFLRTILNGMIEEAKLENGKK